MTAAKDAGTKFETDVLKYLRADGHDVERLARKGKLDEGDIVISHPSGDVVLELKVRRNQTTPLSLGSLYDEAVVEAGRYAKARNTGGGEFPALIIKRNRKGIGQSFVVLDLEDFTYLLGEL